MADFSAEGQEQVNDAEASGLDAEGGATCRFCGVVYSADTKIWAAVSAAYDRYLEAGQ